MIVFFILLCCSIILSVNAHDKYSGSCPKFTPMEDFDWERFSASRWYVTEKFDTSSRCLTYKFEEDEYGFKNIVQNSIITTAERLSIDNNFIYRGRLVSPSRAEPGRMIVRFPLNPIGPASFVILDTDYENYGLICTCQVVNLFFIFKGHRRSCSILQKFPERNATISSQLHKMINDQIESTDSQLPDHDFDFIDHRNCVYDDDTGIQLDVDKFLGLNGETPVEAAVGAAVDQLGGGLFKNDPEKFKEEIAINAPIKRSNPRV